MAHAGATGAPIRGVFMQELQEGRMGNKRFVSASNRVIHIANSIINGLLADGVSLLW
jgi:hypothetical protein